MKEGEMERVAGLIDEVLTRKDDATVARVHREVGKLTDGFPLYHSAPKARR